MYVCMGNHLATIIFSTTLDPQRPMLHLLELASQQVGRTTPSASSALGPRTAPRTYVWIAHTLSMFAFFFFCIELSMFACWRSLEWMVIYLWEWPTPSPQLVANLPGRLLQRLQNIYSPRLVSIILFLLHIPCILSVKNLQS